MFVVVAALVMWLGVLSGCWRSHARSDGSRLDAGLDAHEPELDADTTVDAGCVPQLSVPTDCRVDWARAIGSDAYVVIPGRVRVREDGSALALVQPAGGRVSIDSFEFGVGGFSALLSFDRGGAVSWALDSRGEVLWTNRDVVSNTRGYPHGLERLAVADGSLLSAEPLPDPSDLHALAQAGCAAACATREVRALSWHDRVDLGALGVLEAPFGFSIVLLEDDAPRWHWSTSLDFGLAPIVIFPTTGIAPDGSLTFLLWTGGYPTPAPLCLVGAPCFNFPDALLVRLSPTGTVDFARVLRAARSLVMTDDGGSIVSANDELTRFDARGERVWRNDRVGGFGGLLATDARTGELWATLGIPEAPLDLAGTTVTGCELNVGVSVLVTLDPFTGEFVRTNGTFRGWATAMEPHPEGGVVMELATYGRPSSQTMCGRTIQRDDVPGGPIDLIVAHVR